MYLPTLKFVTNLLPLFEYNQFSIGNITFLVTLKQLINTFHRFVDPKKKLKILGTTLKNEIIFTDSIAACKPIKLLN